MVILSALGGCSQPQSELQGDGNRLTQKTLTLSEASSQGIAKSQAEREPFGAKGSIARCLALWTEAKLVDARHIGGGIAGNCEVMRLGLVGFDPTSAMQSSIWERAAALGQLMYLGWWRLPFEQNAGPFNRKNLEAIVAEVRARRLTPGESADLRLDDIYKPRSLHLRKKDEGVERCQGKGNVWASMTTAGKLKVVIETSDQGHAGEFGFAYSDEPLSLIPDQSPPDPFADSPSAERRPSTALECYHLGVPGRLDFSAPRLRIDRHWWEVYKGLMD